MTGRLPEPMAATVMSQAEREARTWGAYQNAVMWGDMEDAEWWWHRLQQILKASEKRERSH